MIIRKFFLTAFIRQHILPVAMAGLGAFVLSAGQLEAATAPGGQQSVNQMLKSRTPAQVNVVDEDGKPLEGVQILIQPRPEMLIPEKIYETTSTVTDKGGTFQQPQIEVGDTYVLLRKKGFATLALNASKPFPRTLTLHPGRTISGKLFSSDGQPISGAVVGPVSFEKSKKFERTANSRTKIPRIVSRTETDGSFSLDGLSLDSLSVQFTAPGFTPRLISFDAGNSEQKVGLETGGAIIKGKVLGSKDRAPQASVAIEAQADGIVLYTATDAEGNYIFDNLPIATWSLRPGGGGPLSGTQSREKVVDLSRKDEVQDVPLVLNQGVILAGRAVDAATSEPLPGINITLSGYGQRAATARLTDRNGDFNFDNLDSLQDVIIRFDPVKFVFMLPGGAYRDYYDLSQVGDTDYDVTTLTIPLHRRLEVRGSVKDAAGKPAPDVEVRIQSLDVISSTPSKGGPGPLEFAAYTNGEGDFRTGIYPGGHYKVWAQQDALVSQVKPIDVYTTSPAPAVDLKIDQAAQVEGMVTDANDKIVTGAVVIAWAADSPAPTEDPIPGRENYRFTKTDKDGHFTLSGLRGEPLVIRATHKSYVQPAEVSFNPASIMPGTSSSLALKFPAGGDFTAQVLDDQGQPVSQAEVTLSYQVDLDGSRFSVVSDSYGNAHIGSLPVNRVEKIAVNHPAFAPYSTAESTVLPVSNMKISLQKRGALMATITGVGLIKGVVPEVFLLYAPIVSGSDTPPDQGFEQTARQNVVAGKALFQSLPPGWYKVVFADSGAYAESETAKMEAGSGDQEVNLALPEGNHLVGIVMDKQSAEGIDGANITLNPAVDSAIVAERATQNTTTQDGGTFELYNVGAGKLHVKVLAAGYPDYEKTITFEPGQTLEIEMTNVPSVLEGTVTSAGSPVDGALLILSKGGSNPAPLATSITDESGAYKMEGFSAGSYTLSIEAPIGDGENITRKSVTVDVEGEHATKDVDFAALVTVSGSVKLGGKIPTRSGGEPIVLLFRGVESGTESKMVPIASGGKFSTQLEPGNYQVSLEDREGKTVEIPAGGTHSLDLSF